MSASRPAPSQRVRLVTVADYGPEPIGEEQALSIQRQYLHEALRPAPNDEPTLRSVGDPSWSSTGDLGPLQSFTVARTVPARNAAFKGFSTALPATSGSSSSIQDQLAGLGI